jgi:hypothetical protein
MAITKEAALCAENTREMSRSFAKPGTLLALVICSAGLTQAAPFVCPSVSTTLSGFAIPGTGGGTPNNTIATFNGQVGQNNTCTAGDLNVSQFASAPGGNTDPTHTYMFSNDPVDPASIPVDFFFATVRGSGGTEGGTNDPINNYTATGGTLNGNVTYLVDVTDSAKISSITLNMHDVIVGAGAGSGASFTVSVCYGVTAATIHANFNSGECATAGGTYVASALVANAGDGYSGTYNLPTNVTRLAVNNAFTIVGGASSTTSFLTWDESFAQGLTVPEPATFGATLAGLAAVVAMKRRRRA